MAEQQFEAGEVDKAEEVLDVVLPAGNESSEVVHPCKQPFYLSAIAIAAQLASILRFGFPPSAVWSN
jgi:hypothetical protein